MRNLKCWWYKDELNALQALAFAARLSYDDAVSTPTKRWRTWAESFGVDVNDFEDVRYWLEQRDFVAYLNGRYRITKAGAEWYNSLRKRKLVY